MELTEAKQLASVVKQLPGVVPLGVRTVDGEKALVLRVNRRKLQVTNPTNALGKLAKIVGIKGHAFTSLGLCSECYRDNSLKQEADGHFHEVFRNYSQRQGAAEPVCCRCIRRLGIKCTAYENIRPAKAKSRKTVGRRGK